MEKISIYPSKHFVTPEESLKEAIDDIENELAIR